tara:strand:- start:1524 stop:1682 length:159 start_codon:yes stop_codon:yes gene_type:complete
MYVGMNGSPSGSLDEKSHRMGLLYFCENVSFSNFLGLDEKVTGWGFLIFCTG